MSTQHERNIKRKIKELEKLQGRKKQKKPKLDSTSLEKKKKARDEARAQNVAKLKEQFLSTADHYEFTYKDIKKKQKPAKRSGNTSTTGGSIDIEAEDDQAAQQHTQNCKHQMKKF